MTSKVMRDDARRGHPADNAAVGFHLITHPKIWGRKEVGEGGEVPGSLSLLPSLVAAGCPAGDSPTEQRAAAARILGKDNPQLHWG